jgi:exodeoxyribonuclease VII large subunit
VTLADLAADVRAATPSNAAEIAVRDHREVRHRVEILASRAARGVRHGLDRRRRHLRQLIDKYGFRRQRDALVYWRHRVDDLLERLVVRMRATVSGARHRLAAVQSRYGLREWPRTLARRRDDAGAMRERLTALIVDAMHARRMRLAGYEDRLRALSPRRVMERGYCLVRRPDGTLLRVAAELAVNDPVTIEFARGEADARIGSVRTGEDDAREQT